MTDGELTFLFADLEGSTRLLTQDPDGYPALLAQFHRALTDVSASHDGELVSVEGDGAFIVFRDPSSAVDAGRAIIDQVSSHDRRLRVRVGVHTGTARRTPTGFVGLDIHRAARVADAAHGGQLVATESVVDSIGTAGALDLGWHHLRDLDTAVRIHQYGAGDFPPLRTLTARLHNVPEPPGRLVGRDVDLDRIVEAIDGGGLVTITGPGGVGKTRLATAAARETAADFRDGVWFVDLTTVTDPRDVLSQVLVALGSEGSEEPVESLVVAGRDREMLIVLDNMEHVIGSVMDLARVVPRLPGVVFLVTSREALRITPERLVTVEPLGEEAVDLFETRLAEAGIELVADARDAARAICRLVDGLPLAVELAASAARTLGVQGVLDRLSEGAEPLAQRRRDAPSRHRRITDTIGWSHDLLDPVEQVVFRRLAIAPAPQMMDAVMAVAAEPGVDVAGVVDALVDKSLVEIRTTDRGEPRVRMLDLIRRYAGTQLEASGEASDVERRHAVFWADWGDEVEPALWGTRVDDLFATLADQVSNLETALTWSFAHEPILAARIVGGFQYFLFRSAVTGARERWFEPASAVDGLDALTTARIWSALGYASWAVDHRAGHRQAFERSLAAAKAAGDVRLQIVARANIAVGDVGRPERYESARRDAEAAAEDALAADLPLVAAQALNVVGELARNAGDVDTADRAYQETLRIIEPIGDRYRRRMILTNLIFLDIRRGRPRAALERSLETIGVSRELGFIDEMDLVGPAEPLLLLGRPASAAVVHGAARSLLARTNRSWQPGDEAEIARLEARLEAELGEERLRELYDRGRVMSPDSLWSLVEEEAASLLGQATMASIDPAQSSDSM